MDWQKVHFKSIESAYRSSPFYEFFMDEFMFVFEQREKYLYDLNEKILAVILELLQIDPSGLCETEAFIKPSETGGHINDFRNVIHPKSKTSDSEFTITKYHQVFEEKHGFIANLSVLDLLFNEGANSGGVLNKESSVIRD